MRFNTHCHVFNLQSIFNDATAFILYNRMVLDNKVPPVIATAIINKLKEIMAHGGGFDSVGSDPGDFSSTSDGLLGSVEEFWQAMHLAMLKNMDMVTDDMVRQLLDDVIFTPLMMDILVAPQLGPKTGDVFDDQLAGTKRQIVRYPGRILPFYAVNPFRWDFVNRAIDALEHGGFVGVKLYPSLGYPIDAPGMDGVMHYCNANQIPLLMHCNHGGFKQSDGTVDFCAPSKWGGAGSYLETYPNLKICFGHFGGEENFTGPEVPPQYPWTNDILALMGTYPGQVFADVSFHDVAYNAHPTNPSPASVAYFQSLNAIMADPRYQTQVLWGSDTWLLRMVCKELDYWGAFMPPNTVSDECFKRMCQDNSRAFLGIDAANPKPNILGYMNYMQANAGWSHADALAWLTKAAS
jgi:predicted TIM-barrel fold metal-dependent hydrolase